MFKSISNIVIICDLCAALEIEISLELSNLKRAEISSNAKCQRQVQIVMRGS